MLDLSTVYELVDPIRGNALRVESDVSTEKLEALATGQWRPKTALRCKRFQGSKLYDVVWGGDVEVCLISVPVAKLLEDHRVSGWTTFPVELIGARRVEIPGYVGFSVTGRSGPIDDSLSKRVEVRSPAGGRATELVGLLFDPLSWDGSDAFMPRGRTHRFVTGRVAELLRVNRVSNLELRRIVENRRLDL